MLECVREGKTGVLIDVGVTPNSKKGGDAWNYDKFGKRLRVRVSSPAIYGKANKEIIKIFSDMFGDCEILKGGFSRKKTLLIRGWDIEDISKRLEDILGVQAH